MTDYETINGENGGVLVGFERGYGGKIIIFI